MTEIELKNMLANAVKQDNVSLLKEAISNGANVNHSRSTTLKDACFTGKIAIVKYIVGKIKAVTDFSNPSALKYAVGGGYMDVIKYLVSEGFDFKSDDNACFKTACSSEKLEVAEYLLGLGVNIKEIGERCMLNAVYLERINVIKFLHSHGIDLSIAEKGAEPDFLPIVLAYKEQFIIEQALQKSLLKQNSFKV